MNKIIKNNQKSAILALLTIVFTALACSGTKPEMPNTAAVQSLIKSSMAEFADAVDKNDFATFKKNASADFQQQFSDDQLKSSFKVFVDKKDQVVPILRDAAAKDAKFSPDPTIREENGNYILVAKGTLDSAETETKFDTEYVWRDNSWKLLKFFVNL